ncbi:MAG: GspE/PulE/PilB domain-containing protein [Polyangia bacterium]
MPPRKDLGAILVDEDVLDAKDLERVARGKEGARRPLWAILVESELATADQIFRALSGRFGVPVVSDERLVEMTPPEALKRAISRPEALLAGLLPIDLTADGQRATVVMVDPSDEQTLAEFLTRAQVPEGRALLARREAIIRAVERVYGETTAVVTPLPPSRKKTLPSAPQQVIKPVTDEDITGTVKLDPSLQAEISRLPPRMSQADALTPLPQRRPKRPTPPSTEAAPRAPETPSEALRAEERLTRALVEAVEALSSELEARVVGGSGSGAEMARLARRVARQLGLGRRVADEIGVAAHLFALDRAMRQVEGAASADVFAELGWSGAGADGLLPILRSLTAASSGFGRLAPGAQAPAIPIGARIIGAVADYQELGAAATATPDLDTVSQLLRASSAGAQVVDALLRVLESDRGDKTPATPTTLPATSMLREKPAVAPADVEDDEEEEPPTPPPTLSDGDKTQRKPYPKREGSKGGE